MGLTHALPPLLARSACTIAIVTGATLLGLTAVACGAEPIEESPSVNVAASVATDSADDPVSNAIEAGIVDCLDPLFDSDGGDGFFEFCDRVTEARTAGKIDCIRPGFQPENADCASWRMTRKDVPSYYFAPEETAAPVEVEVEVATPAPLAADTSVDADLATSYSGDMVVLEWNIFGGCDLLDVCGHYRIFGDGSVEASRGRTSAAAGDVDATGQVDPSLVVALINNADTDPTAVVASLAAPGPCASQYDAFDVRLWISPADLRLDSCEFDLYESDHPLVRAAIELGSAAEEAAPVE